MTSYSNDKIFSKKKKNLYIYSNDKKECINFLLRYEEKWL